MCVMMKVGIRKNFFKTMVSDNIVTKGDYVDMLKTDTSISARKLYSVKAQKSEKFEYTEFIIIINHIANRISARVIIIYL